MGTTAYMSPEQVGGVRYRRPCPVEDRRRGGVEPSWRADPDNQCLWSCGTVTSTACVVVWPSASVQVIEIV